MNNTKLVRFIRVIIAGIALLIMPQITLFAQNDPQISHFMFAQTAYNPAFSTHEPEYNVWLLARQQWVGFNEAPSTQWIGFDTYFPGIGGFGLCIANDMLGFEKSINLKLQYTFNFQLNEKAVLCPSVGAGIASRSLDGSKLIYEDIYVSDPEGLYSMQNEMIPDFDFGIRYLSPSLTFGLSSSHIANSITGTDFFQKPRHIYLFGAYRIKSDKIEITPSFLVKSSIFITHVDINGMFTYNDKFWFGLSYRLQEAITGLIGLKFYSKYMIGYSYDLHTGPVKSANCSGSHEIFLKATFLKPEKPYSYYKTPRLFN
ncbi:MAG: type IX secretion system membrane protein PorP/SprF [Bacteroidetes bacterium]|nr:type IX secretion system membrane protein PorP/SprF [Bacteroidota bacterium]MBU1719503.1 type IX secretion system membrane protein PorP/SprF [Bacteroidota bacterium]